MMSNCLAGILVAIDLGRVSVLACEWKLFSILFVISLPILFVCVVLCLHCNCDFSLCTQHAFCYGNELTYAWIGANQIISNFIKWVKILCLLLRMMGFNNVLRISIGGTKAEIHSFIESSIRSMSIYSIQRFLFNRAAKAGSINLRRPPLIIEPQCELLYIPFYFSSRSPPFYHAISQLQTLMYSTHPQLPYREMSTGRVLWTYNFSQPLQATQIFGGVMKGY